MATFQFYFSAVCCAIQLTRLHWLSLQAAAMHDAPCVRGYQLPLPSRNCLFVGVVAVAAGAFTWRQSLKTALSSRGRNCQITTSSLDMATLGAYGGGSGVSVPARANPPTGTVIFLHGLGDSGHGWAPVFPLQGLQHVQTVLPTADEQPVSLNMGYRMSSWFDLHGLDEDAADDEEGILRSVERVERIVEDQIRMGVPEHRIVVAGFSQGGAVALTYGLRTERRLAGVVGLSSWLPLRSKYPSALSVASKDLDIFMGHGTADQVVSFRFGQKSADFIQGVDRKIAFHSYPGLTHSASAAEMADVSAFVSRVLPRE